MRRLRQLLVTLLALVALLALAVRLTTFHPDDVESVAVDCVGDAPTLSAGQQVKVLSWNVQYLAGKDYVFFYDLLDESGPDERPSAEAIAETLDEVVAITLDEQPDVLLLQELDDGAGRTDDADQLALLRDALDEASGGDAGYSCAASGFYWKAAFVPHPRIMDSVGMKLSTLSRYAIDDATRHQLPTMPSDPLTRQFDLKRAILETRLPVEGGEDLVVLNTHLDAFAQGSDTMQRQVALTKELLDELSAAGQPWVIGGDFNLLPPGDAWDELPDDQRAYYAPASELAVLTDAYPVVPSVEDTNGPDRERWFTHYPNDPAVDGPDRTIDFLFHSPLLALGEHEVRADDTLEVSDHLPVVVTYTLP